jgi:high-affinity nickel permease
MNKFEKIAKPVFFISCIFVFILGLSEIIVANSMVTLGKQVKTINDELDVLINENEALERKIASASSLSTIEFRARNLGFVERAKTLRLGQESLSVRLGTLR